VILEGGLYGHDRQHGPDRFSTGLNDMPLGHKWIVVTNVPCDLKKPAARQHRRDLGFAIVGQRQGITLPLFPFPGRRAEREVEVLSRHLMISIHQILFALRQTSTFDNERKDEMMAPPEE